MLTITNHKAHILDLAVRLELPREPGPTCGVHEYMMASHHYQRIA